MKKRIARSAKALIFIVAAALLFSGFTTAGGTRLEKEAADLMLRRTEAMQRAMSHGGSDADIYSHLAAVEAHPLLKEDMESISDFRESDADKVINMKVIRCEMKEKTANTRFFDISVKWYLLGYDGYYSEEQTYRIRTVTQGRKMYLSDMQPV